MSVTGANWRRGFGGAGGDVLSTVASSETIESGVRPDTLTLFRGDRGAVPRALQPTTDAVGVMC